MFLTFFSFLPRGMWLRGLERNPCRFLRINELLRILFFTDLFLWLRGW